MHILSIMIGWYIKIPPCIYGKSHQNINLHINMFSHCSPHICFVVMMELAGGRECRMLNVLMLSVNAFRIQCDKIQNISSGSIFFIDETVLWLCFQNLSFFGCGSICKVGKNSEDGVATLYLVFTDVLLYTYYICILCACICGSENFYFMLSYWLNIHVLYQNYTYYYYINSCGDDKLHCRLCLLMLHTHFS